VAISVSEWLPPDAFTEDAVRPALDQTVSVWSARWFVGARAVISAVHPGGVKPRMAQSLQVKGGVPQAELPGRGKRTLLEAALGTDLSGLTLTECDHRVLDDFAAEAIKDLLAALDSLGEGGANGPSLCVTLSLEGKEMVCITLPGGVLIPTMKAAIGAVRRRGAAPRSRVDALKPVKLMAEGLLGRAEVTLDDLRDLAVGDVVVLDSSLKSMVELRLPGNSQRIGRGRLVRTNEQISIQF